MLRILITNSPVVSILRRKNFSLHITNGVMKLGLRLLYRATVSLFFLAIGGDTVHQVG